jgi:Rieske Fe-S protein
MFSAVYRADGPGTQEEALMGSERTSETGPTSRRAVLAGAAGVSAAVALAACGNDNDGDKSSGSDTTTGGGTPTGNTDTGAGNTDTKPLATKSDIPTGGGKVFDKQQVVITQPSNGTFKAFSAVCTHMGCTVGDVSGGTINCPCHGSAFSIADGSVKNGPASRPLAEKMLKVEGDSLTLG